MLVDHRLVIIGIAGQGGSGKSTLARELARVIPVAVAIVEGDDFYSETSDNEKSLMNPKEGYESYFDWRRLQSAVLSATRDKSNTLRYQRYDWNAGSIGEWIEISMPEVVIVEGVYTLRPQLRDWFDVTVFVRTNEHVRLQRQELRGENSRPWIDRWIAAEDYYVSHEGNWEWVDFLVEGE